MKKIKLLLVMLSLGLFTGCYKFETTMSITEDKKVSIDVIYGIMNVDLGDEELQEDKLDDELNDELDENNLDNVELEDIEDEDENESLIDCNELKSNLNGFEVEEYMDDQFVGCKLSKKYDSIDDITTDKEIIIELSNIANGDSFDDSKLFQKKGNGYIGHFTFSLGEETEGQDLSAYKDMFKLSYVVNLPLKNISNNATKVSEDGKTLTWELDPTKKNDIKYEFSFEQSSNIILYVGIAVGILVIGAIIFIAIKKSSKSSVNN